MHSTVRVLLRVLYSKNAAKGDRCAKDAAGVSLQGAEALILVLIFF